MDVSIRPGWYYHPEQDDEVKSLEALLDIYYHSVGRNGSLLLNFPVDVRGLIHENDVIQLQKWSAQLKKDFADNLAENQLITASNTRGNHKSYAPQQVLDDNPNTYWATDDNITNASLIIEFEKPIRFNRFLVQEYIALGQRVKEFTVAVKSGSGWKQIASGTTIGYKRILRTEEITTEAIRFTVKDAKGCPLISNMEVYLAAF